MLIPAVVEEEDAVVGTAAVVEDEGGAAVCSLELGATEVMPIEEGGILTFEAVGARSAAVVVVAVAAVDIGS